MSSADAASRRFVVSPADGTAIAMDRAGAGPALLLVHGSGAGRQRWRPILPHLHGKVTLYTMDRRGHGQSGDATRYDITFEYDDIAACVAAIDESAVTVVAHSFGGLCALGAAARSPKIRRLALYEPPIPAEPNAYFRPDLIPSMRAALSRGDADAALTAFVTQVHGAGPEDIGRMRQLSAWAAQTAMVPIILRELEAVGSFQLDATPPAVPVLLLLGGDSPNRYRSTMDHLLARLPDATLQILPGQGHGAIDAAPEQVARAVLNFLPAPAD